MIPPPELVQPEPEKIVVATANARMGELFREPFGWERFAPLVGVDILLLQEVHPERDDLERVLERELDLRLVAAVGGLGLAIAVNASWQAAPVPSGPVLFREPGPISRTIRRASAERYPRIAHSTRRRGMLGVEFTTPAGHEGEAWTTHPVIGPRRIYCNAQIAQMEQPMNQRPPKKKLFVGADFNHMRGPRRADLAMRAATNLSTVDTGNTPTFDMSASNHAWLATLFPSMTFPGQLDALLYRGEGIEVVKQDDEEGKVVKIDSDHGATIARFLLTQTTRRAVNSRG